MNRILLIVCLPLFCLLFSCERSKKPTDDGLNSDLVKNPITASSRDTSKKIPIFKFYEETFDFGHIKEGQKVHHTFKFKNVGNADLVISNAHGSCGCTIPEYASKPVAPNEEGSIEVTFNSQGKLGANHKTVTLIANTIPNTKILSITGDVKAEDK